MENLTSQGGAESPRAIGELLAGVPFEEYVAADGMNSHGLMDLARSPAHFYERKYNAAPEKDTDALLFGRLLHLAVLESERFLTNFQIEPHVDKRTTVGKNTLADWHARLLPQHIIVPHKFHVMLARMSERVAKNEKAMWLLKGAAKEVTGFWFDDVTGELCKMRADAISEGGIIVDVKTAADARERAFSKACLDNGYALQAGHYTSGAKVIGKMRADAFVYLVIEKVPPYEVCIYPASQSMLATGKRWRDMAMATYHQCIVNEHFPGYNPEAQEIDLPEWSKDLLLGAL